jgi:ABC-type oligopeptide transport system substrate-binding subunit
MTKQFRAIVGATMIVLAAGGATPAGAENVVRFTSDEQVQTFDPHSVWNLETIIATQQVYDRLLNVSSKLEVEPSLATSWRVVDPLAWDFELRQGVRFHVGTPLTAEDVVFSIDRARDEDSELNFLLDSVAGRGGRPGHSVSRSVREAVRRQGLRCVQLLIHAVLDYGPSVGAHLGNAPVHSCACRLRVTLKCDCCLALLVDA